MNAAEALDAFEARARATAAASFPEGTAGRQAADALILVATLRAVLAELDRVKHVHPSKAWVHRDTIAAAFERLGGAR